MRKLIFSFILVLFGTSLIAKTYFIAPSGNDTTGDGSITAPYFSIMKVQQYVVAGDTVFARGGTYKIAQSQISQTFTLGPYATVNYMTKSGSSSLKRICYWAYPGEHPIFDFSNVKPTGYRVTAFYVTGSWLYFKGLEVIGVQVTISTHTQSECFRNEGSNNIFEQLVMHDGMAIGFYLTKGANNLILNCDAYRNWDYFSETGNGGNTDGFGCHPSSDGSGNIFRGCRSWFNSDDGYDCINAYESVTFENCWAFYNGYNTSFVSEGDGNGFKAGGYGQAPVVSKLPSPIPSHTVRFCLAFRNKANGFYSNHHVVTGCSFFNNTAYHNGTNYNMLSQLITKSTKTGNDTTIDCPGFNHVLHNNISFRYSTQTETANLGTCVNTYNSFSPNSGITVSSTDFVSTDESALVAPRQPDGSLPAINFLKLKEGSNLIDKGMYLGFTFYGSAPDLGAFESNYSTESSSIFVDNQLPFYPNPVHDLLYLKNSTHQTYEIFDTLGNRLFTTILNHIDVSKLSKGIYILKINTDQNTSKTYKIIKF